MIAEQLADQNEVSAHPAAEMGNEYIDMFWEDGDGIRLHEQDHVILVECAQSAKKPRPHAAVYPPGRILHVFPDHSDSPPRVYYYTLGTVASTDIVYQDVVEALASVGSGPPVGYRTRYDYARRVDALLNLWPDLYPSDQSSTL
ncbi:hypothetical protein L5G32_09330 [Gordonia sp. HY002]|uniref:hypothetical protein n=1 Tax=Gordonia zhenghanii TaxID=2911516 RepID=UPI001EF0D375|nr:hypothetical protein [Gordonia zhenghanii]MCF8570467.1 hypothetical protein [Gordonia zhenghanii]MCF8602576.1 hypothetical protein [Gordonia zhenghanii]